MNAETAPTNPIVTFETALGRCAVAWSDEGITRVLLPGERTPRDPRVEDRADVPALVRDAIAGMIAVLDGRPDDLRRIALDEHRLDPFRRAVYAATRAIDPGSTASYGEIARMIGRPDTARDVGVALARNPCPIIVPCHRVVSANGALTGFSAPGGIETKRRMLQIEGAPGFGQLALFG
ncbi:MAG TPA: methylated-DNA--[protein]-cysteine S-methyltransferase [Candidatus Deferrimicrobium sp.]|nr:methylated-DNA--[protein]-cysteine S-methyltransferase [Candidatus Deferrimicrobium sp.]